MPSHEYDVVIVGGGVTGTALLYVLSLYSDIRNIALIEKNASVGEVNSHPLNNAQTSHDGGTETNYPLEHALLVQKAAKLLRAYVEARKTEGLFKKTHRMVLGVGEDETRDLREERFPKFKPHYPDLHLAEKDELRVIEPNVVLGRDENEAICAMVSSEGYAVNYQRLSECFLEDVRVHNPYAKVFFNTKIKHIRKENGVFTLETNTGVYRASVVVCAAGAYSLLFAQELGYGMHLGILPVAGSFYSSGPLLKGKVYRVQIEGMPFAAIHGDPDVLNQADTRFGPTTKPLPFMERHRPKTFFDYVKLPIVSLRGLWVLTKLLMNKKLLGYVFKNALYDLPVIGPYLFLREARVIVPTLTYQNLKLRKGAGGIRPQIVNLETGELEMGDKTLVGENCIFNTTPSPGASVCLANAHRDAKQVAAFLGKKYSA
ncbi:MAG: FAD-dependent oxidoreductase [Parcubacteria group bacterium]|nr:FAD-dependent oxidoreductase [Candidatus Wildermuthbacteria bacterium]MBI2108784.1 FAD-dependent oxidoreductase [Parcubacteria group bacterium]